MDLALISVSGVHMGRNVLYKTQKGCTDLQTVSEYIHMAQYLTFCLPGQLQKVFIVKITGLEEITNLKEFFVLEMSTP